jgi:HNH endonuclease
MPILHADRREVAEVQPSRVRNQDRELVICALYSGGETMAAIAKRFPSSYTGRTLTRERVRQILKRNGLGGDGRLTRVDPLRVLAMVSECSSAKEIVRRTGYSEVAVRRVLQVLSPTAIPEMMAYRHEALRERMLGQIRALADRLGRRPLKEDLDQFGPYQGRLQLVFGSMSKAMTLAGFAMLRNCHPHMTAAQRTEIALRYEPPKLGRRGGGNAKELAAEYGVTPNHIGMIAKSFRAAA